MKCGKCEYNLFSIKITKSCDGCPENGAWDESEDIYIYDEKVIIEKKLDRDQVNEDGECGFETAHGLGCHMYTCGMCGDRTNLHIVDS